MEYIKQVLGWKMSFGFGLPHRAMSTSCPRVKGIDLCPLSPAGITGLQSSESEPSPPV